mmetsp:Transcript_13902/g.19131  ORF Transcript_13902/g.19131 Transcript_13902/m.19131 type:complete len:343 (+) Transcript_13902:80-1108(+)
MPEILDKCFTNREKQLSSHQCYKPLVCTPQKIIVSKPKASSRRGFRIGLPSIRHDDDNTSPQASLPSRGPELRSLSLQRRRSKPREGGRGGARVGGDKEPEVVRGSGSRMIVGGEVQWEEEIASQDMIYKDKGQEVVSSTNKALLAEARRDPELEVTVGPAVEWLVGELVEVKTALKAEQVEVGLHLGALHGDLRASWAQMEAQLQTVSLDVSQLKEMHAALHIRGTDQQSPFPRVRGLKVESALHALTLRAKSDHSQIIAQLRGMENNLAGRTAAAEHQLAEVRQLAKHVQLQAEQLQEKLQAEDSKSLSKTDYRMLNGSNVGTFHYSSNGNSFDSSRELF